MTLNKSSIRQDVFHAVFNVLNGSLTDTISPARDKYIFTAIPDVVSSRFCGYPFIIVDKSQIEKSFPVFDDDYSDKATPIPITVFHTSNETLDLVCDNIDVVMTPLNFPQFKFKDYDEDTGNVTLAGNNVHFRSMTYFVELDTTD